MSLPSDEEKKPETFHNTIEEISVSRATAGIVSGEFTGGFPVVLAPGLSEQLEMIFTEKIEPTTPPPNMVAPITASRTRLDKPKCSVCNEDGDGLHFGAEACRACTAFFRRSIALNKKYNCRAGGNCEVSSNIRCMCRACRFDKCIASGMNPDCVRNKRENTDGLDFKNDYEMEAKLPKMEIPKPIPQLHPHIASFSTPYSAPIDLVSVLKESPSSFASFSPASLPGLSSSPSTETMPLLECMRINYEKMENARSVIHRREGENYFQQKKPQPINFRQAAEVTTREVSLVADWVAWCFEEDFKKLPSEQKTILFQNFFIYFSMLERAFMTVKSGVDGICVLASKDYVDYNNLEQFFEECGSETSGTPADIAKLCRLIRPSFELQKRSLINLLRLEEVDQYEFFALCVMLFWDFGLEGQTDECNSIGRNVKQRVSREMTFYLRNVKKYEEPLHRMASVLSILPSLQRVVRRFQEDIEMASIFNIYALPANFYNIVNGKFT